MSERSDGPVTIREVYDLVAKVDDKVDAQASRLDKLEGALAMVRWLGPAGLAALVFGVAKSAGLL